ncbi:hypothetical protein INT45_005378 [Circinella minor]|uniref:Uncharacterized protein n=1 Tax=Circinella minor TaxID=1195481 RepID=A0A8H7RWQ9_9FUNG|nr:hypothetical protein INT45_005378 [Circinella minor]
MDFESLYPGAKELTYYIKNVKSPTLTGFVKKNSNHIAEWSCRISAENGLQLFSVWKKRFLKRCRELGENYVKSNSSFQETTWNNFYEEVEQLATVHQISRVEGLRVLGQSIRDVSASTINSIPEDENQDYSENILSEEQTAEILFQIYYKKCKSEQLSNEDMNVIRRTISRTDKSMYMKVLSYGAETLLKENLDASDHMIIKSSLSGIVNLLQPDLYDNFKSIFTTNEFEELEKNDFNLPARDDIVLIDDLKNKNIDEMINTINLQKYNISIAGKRNTDQYKILEVLEEVISNFDDGNDDLKSETAVYRKCANVLDIILRGTKLVLIDGENVSECSKTELEIMTDIVNNKQLCATTSSSYSYGRKVDLIIATFYNGVKYELSSNEWKKEKSPDTLIKKQQCKNLRTNASILKNIMKNNKDGSKYILSMDWFGYTGYIYTLKFVDGLFVANIYDTLQIPRNTIQLKKFKSTLTTLFIWKDFLVSLKDEITTVADSLQTRDRLRGIIRRRDADETIFKMPPTLFSPKLGKRKLNEE